MSESLAQRRKNQLGRGTHGLANHSLHSVTAPRFLGRLRFQLLIGIFATVLLPPIIYYLDRIPRAWEQPHSVSTTLGALAAFLIAIYLFRRAITFPGIGIVGHVLPATTAGYGLVLIGYLGLRLEYSRLIFAMSFVAAVLFFFAVSTYVRNRKGQCLYLVPSEATTDVPLIPHLQWVTLRKPELPNDPTAVLVADLRADLGDEWERLIARAAVAGHPVYHVKQVQESLTGRVEIEHLSENSFGSLIPNLSYRKIKRIIDLCISLAVFPLLVLPALLIALAIKLESPGPVLFRQKRRGYRGSEFEVVKFRTMTCEADDVGSERDQAITRDGDQRVTGVGRFLRRTRIDELPQIWNIIKGEMSWIGPRPEALPLSEWYEAELPFYTYRHIVRPGISGWAQVHQGHVSDLGAVYEKLHYDFYYIKNFSAWLDLLILGKTISIVISGYGAK
jgi:lipopolysaccharide/colanic/teichoic acid biosynthesis glycosyltransferase